MSGPDLSPSARRAEHTNASGRERATCVAHVTSHHHPTDPRIFHECRALAEAGYRVLLVAPARTAVCREGVEIVPVPPYRSRLERFLRTSRLAVRIALDHDPAVVHLHDPELLPWALWLHARGRRVIYDLHEDFVTAAYDRDWVPELLRPAVAAVVRLFLRLATRRLPTVIAERYYAAFAPGGIEILNYARIDRDDPLFDIERTFTGHIHLIYTGSITRSRGAANHLELLKRLPPVATMTMVGRCPDPSLLDMIEAVRHSDPRLRVDTSPDWIPWDRVVGYYRQPLTAGLAVFPDTPHYREKELTKFFEYMAAGLPIICSNFPVWRELVEGNRVGICVDPEDPTGAVAAARWLVDHPDEARAMGERGRQLVRERFNWESQAEKLVAFYRRLLGDESPTAERAAATS